MISLKQDVALGNLRTKILKHWSKLASALPQKRHSRRYTNDTMMVDKWCQRSILTAKASPMYYISSANRLVKCVSTQDSLKVCKFSLPLKILKVGLRFGKQDSQTSKFLKCSWWSQYILIVLSSMFEIKSATMRKTSSRTGCYNVEAHLE